MALRAVVFVLCAAAMAVLTESEPLSDERSCLICKAVAETGKGNHHLLGASNRQQALVALCDNIRSFGEKDFCLSLQNHAFDYSNSEGEECQSMGHCPPRKHLIGSERCTWGPSYWCQSLVHAQSCGATSHCVERQWTGPAPQL